jgi:hypothetical protein
MQRQISIFTPPSIFILLRGIADTDVLCQASHQVFDGP